MPPAISVLKLGGELIDAPADLARTADAIASLVGSARLIVVHGGGKAIDAELARRGLSPEKRDGIRVTDAAALDAVVSVLGGLTNATLVAALVARGVRAVGLTGADDGLAMSTRVTALRTVAGGMVDPGLVGQPQPGDSRLLADLAAAGYVPVIASIGVTVMGSLLNVNADVMAAHVAASVGAARLLVAGTTPGVLDARGSRLDFIDRLALESMLTDGTATAGMVAKLRACREARDAGVADVRIVDGRSDRFESGTALR